MPNRGASPRSSQPADKTCALVEQEGTCSFSPRPRPPEGKPEDSSMHCLPICLFSDSLVEKMLRSPDGDCLVACLLVEHEDMSCGQAGRHVLLFNKKTCILVEQEDICLLSRRACLLVEHADMHSVEQEDMSSC